MEWKKLDNTLNYARRSLKLKPHKRYVLCYHIQRCVWSLLDCDSARQIVQHYQDPNHYLLARLTAQQLIDIIQKQNIQMIEVDIKAHAHCKAHQSGLPLLADLIIQTEG